MTNDLPDGWARCARPDCAKIFQKKTHNQKYDTDECCRIATNAQIMKRYYKNKARKQGEVRYCDCGTKLSRYNEKDICRGCQRAKAQSGKDELLRQLGFLNY